jgi:hypothetical protein
MILSLNILINKKKSNYIDTTTFLLYNMSFNYYQKKKIIYKYYKKVHE